MTNNKIEEAAKDNYLQYADPRKVHLDKFQISEESFKAGVNWFKKNLWHQMSEKPEVGSEILIQGDLSKLSLGLNANNTFVTEIDYHSNWTRGYANSKEYLRWCYIEDLLKGGEK